MKSKHIYWSPGLKCDHHVWPWPWPWPWIFKVIYGIWYISAKNVAIVTKWKANTLIDLKTSNVTIRFDLGHDLDLEFSRSNMELAISLPKIVRLPRNEKQTYWLNSRPQMWPPDLTLAVTLTLNFQGQIWNLLYLNQKWSDCHETKSKHIDLNSRPQMWPMGLTLAMTLIFEFSRSNVILTILWPRIYQIVTRVTSDVGVSSSHLVLMVNGWGISCETALIWVSLDQTYDKSTLGQVMAWCRQVTSHYLSQCWPRSLSPYGVTRPQWVNTWHKWPYMTIKLCLISENIIYYLNPIQWNDNWGVFISLNSF